MSAPRARAGLAAVALATAGVVVPATGSQAAPATLAAPAHAAAPPPAAATGGESLPVVYSGAAALAHATAHPDTPPAGANDWSCRPTAAHPNPVVLVHGTAENMTYNWYTLSPLLANHGYCVFALNYGQDPRTPTVGLPGARHPGGTRPVAESAVELGAFVDLVRAATGAAEVDIVGHSQGGMMPRYYLKFLGGAAKVDKLIGLAPSNHGTTLFGLNNLPGVTELTTLALGPSVADQQHDSPFIARLNAGGDTVPGVTYTVIATRFDEVVTPPESSFLDGPGVTNIMLQDHCVLDWSDHLAISFNSHALGQVLHALDPAQPRPRGCGVSLPVLGG
jgi:triacylglycerol esterase/lipase EstA (alpha/beta hydrolase family)